MKQLIFILLVLSAILYMSCTDDYTFPEDTAKANTNLESSNYSAGCCDGVTARILRTWVQDTCCGYSFEVKSTFCKLGVSNSKGLRIASLPPHSVDTLHQKVCYPEVLSINLRSGGELCQTLSLVSNCTFDSLKMSIPLEY